MSQAKLRLKVQDENERAYSIHEFEATNEKFKKIEVDNRHLKTEIDDLKTELENQKFSDKVMSFPYQHASFEKTSSFRVLSNEIEDLTKQLELKNLESLFNEKKFSQNFQKIQLAYKYFIKEIQKLFFCLVPQMKKF